MSYHNANTSMNLFGTGGMISIGRSAISSFVGGSSTTMVSLPDGTKVVTLKGKRYTLPPGTTNGGISITDGDVKIGGRSIVDIVGESAEVLAANDPHNQPRSITIIVKPDGDHPLTGDVVVQNNGSMADCNFTTRIDGPVQGSVKANYGSVEVTGWIGGDATSSQGDVRIGGNVAGNARTSQGNVVVQGDVGGDAHSSQGNVRVHGRINAGRSPAAAVSSGTGSQGELKDELAVLKQQMAQLIAVKMEKKAQDSESSASSSRKRKRQDDDGADSEDSTTKKTKIVKIEG